MTARKALCGYCGELRPVRLDGRFREHLGVAGRRCAGGGRVVVIPAGEAEPGDVVEFAGGGGGRVRVAGVPFSHLTGEFAGRYVTIRHDPADVPAGAPRRVLTVCFADTLVRLAGTVMSAAAPADG